MRGIASTFVAIISILALSFATPRDASGSIIYQSIPDLSVAPVSSHCSTCGSGTQQIGEQFSLGSSASIDSINFVVQSDFFWPTPVTISIYQDGPGAVLGTQLYAATFSSFASDLPASNGPIKTDIVGVFTPDLDLGAGTYDIIFSNPVNLGIAVFLGGAGNEILLHDSAFPPSVGNSYVHPVDMGLILSDVPEPASLSVFAAALLGLGLVRRRKRTSRSQTGS